MKFLIHSNAPNVRTGYGVQTALLADRLASAGHEVAVSATWGQPSQVGEWTSPSGHKIRVYPHGDLVSGDDVIVGHAHQWFGPSHDGWIIPLLDVWSMMNPQLDEFNIAAWAPVDHDPVPPGVIKFFERTKARCVAMSRHGERQFKAAGLDPTYIPLAVDTNVYKPTWAVTVDGREVSSREFYDLHPNAFVVGMVGMNKDPNDRKGFSETFQAFARFHAKHPNAILFVHTQQTSLAGGLNLLDIVRACGIPEGAVQFANQYAYRVSQPSVNMAAAYTAMDVLVAPSAGEGFCVPLVEAQACFPADTLATAVDIEEVFEHAYTGDLYRIETDRGDIIEATSDHPFWTASGWVPANRLSRNSEHRLLYTGGHAEAEHVHAGRLGNLVASLRDDAASASRGTDGAHLQFGALAQGSDGSDEAVLADRADAPNDCNGHSIGLYGRTDRRRGHSLDPQVQREVEAPHSDRELVGAAHGLAVVGVRDAGDLHRAAASEALGWSDALHVPHTRPRPPAALRSSTAAHGHQGAAVGVPHRVHSDEAVTEPRGTVDRPPVGVSATRTEPEYQAIRSISRRAVVDFPVYNLRTKSGTYMAAGYLVHNCGTPVIASDFTAQPELIGAGWEVTGQRWWDPASHSWYQRPNVDSIVEALELAYAADFETLQEQAITFAANYDADRVFAEHWVPYIATLDDRPAADKPKMEQVAVIVPAMQRPENVARLMASFQRSTNPLTATVYYVCDEDDHSQESAVFEHGGNIIDAKRGSSFACKVNAAVEATVEDWLFICGDDVEFTPGWIEAARELSDRYDVIGTNDSEPGRVRNPKVANGSHSDHFFIRRSYVEEQGASLEGPGILAPEAYYHFYTDVEIIQLAKARGVFSPCLDSIVIHHHPGYDGREDLREADAAYMKAQEFSEMDRIAFTRRAGLIDQHKVVRGDIWR